MKMTVRDIVEISMLVAIAIVLDLPFLKIRIGVNGGSISLTMVPLFIISIRKNPLKSLVACGIIYGFITCVLDGWGLIYFPFDYFIGYGSICITSFFRNKILNNENKIKGIIYLSVAIIFSSIGRLIGSCLSSMIYYDFSIRESLIYNMTYLVPAFVLSLDVLIFLYKPLLVINNRHTEKSI